jgi:hypothetical protein
LLCQVVLGVTLTLRCQIGYFYDVKKVRNNKLSLF